ncbi:protein kinase C delta type-like [Xenopus laevis]|uniref:Protein kinase C delta type-like n=1 Tax=Xenopus laevis TaxID=8355 RepID=A0A8J1L6S7_XENLA|nr:protein kinase C delta type-like [Xenopus laevis]
MIFLFKRFLSAEMICGLQFLHSEGIIHRDIKPLNVLLDDKGHARISDFGLATQNVFKDDTITGWAGTLGYMAPEILQVKPYNAAVDWWSLGVTIFEMATGDSPFTKSNRKELIDSIIMDNPLIPPWLDDNLKDLMKMLLIKNPRRRLGLRGNIRCHPFYKSIDWAAQEEKGAESPFQPKKVST